MSFYSASNSLGSTFGSGAHTSAAPTQTQGTEQDLANDITVPNPPEDSVSDFSFSPVADFLTVASWDKKVRIYEVTATGAVEGRAMYEHEGPVLSTRWSLDGTKVVSGGADKAVRLYDVQSGQQQQIGAHDGVVRSVRFVEVGPQNTPVVVSGSWDKTLRYWDMRTPNPVCTINLPERVYAMDSSMKLLVAGCADRHLSIIDLNQPDKVFKQIMSPLKYQTRTVTCFLKGDGYALGSIEGRCAIQYVDEQEHKKNGFSFKCQRHPNTTNSTQTMAYSVNAINFHPVYGTFSTAGSDGSFCFWDKDARQRLKSYPSLRSSIPVTAFNRSGTIFAYALSYDWSKGHEFNRPDYPNVIRLHAVKEEEIKQRQKRK
ncbi:unnamed protein product [Kuraishia capsulata CBS 1993]|uniref:Anaphase-promoting complex subunit 4 WD40 domain-containing protein n=1 Tax=Kuraishia capsulata CBS 1993 TaxID=1382522 RepID=W6MGJ4_9ASCO|nr:uncharacterized protein KUCA_T00000609001 [Kuraishia capsulata CBS 1993]CDK24643.1 unnamed protein product [Kuraishia capsulata CBS 1993]